MVRLANGTDVALGFPPSSPTTNTHYRLSKGNIMATSTPSVPLTRAPKILSIIVGVLGVVMLGIGIGVYAYTSSELGAQHITVAAITADAPGALAGKPVQDPVTALAQINAIRHHVSTITGGKTYGELGNVATSDGQTYNKDVTADTSTDGAAHQAGAPLSAADAQTYQARQTAQTASFLQASLLVSVIAFGVAVLIMGLGVILVVIAFAIGTTLRAGLRAIAREATPAP